MTKGYEKASTSVMAHRCKGGQRGPHHHENGESPSGSYGEPTLSLDRFGRKRDG
jgi:hypothetical protein